MFSRASRQLTVLSTRALYNRIYEPAYLDAKPKIPRYPTFQVRCRGYDFPSLESFARMVDRLAKHRFGLHTEAWPVQARTKRVKKFQPRSARADAIFDLAMCERTVQIEGMNSLQMPIFIEKLNNDLPEGIHFTIKLPDPEEASFRMIPDLQLMQLEKELADMQPKEEKPGFLKK